MRRYEQICILHPSLSEDEITRVIEITAQLVQEDKGSIIYLNKWGMRKLAYPIRKELQGYYVLCDFAASPAVVSEIERKFRIDEAVLKYLTVKISDAISPEEIEAARSEAEAQAIVPEPEDESTDHKEDKPSKSAPESPAAAAEQSKDSAPAEVTSEAGEKAENVGTDEKLDSDKQETETTAK